MSTETVKDRLTAGNIAQAIGVSDAKVKKAIKELQLEPVAKKGPCNYYSPEQMEKIRTALEK